MNKESWCANELSDIKLKDGAVYIIQPPKPKSVFSVGDEYYRTSLPVDQHFNWFQKLMWKWCFGVNVEDYNEE